MADDLRKEVTPKKKLAVMNETDPRGECHALEHQRPYILPTLH